MARWGLLVEETKGRVEGMRWTPTVLARIEGSRAQALAELERLARGYVPQHPMRLKRRWLFETADGFLLFAEGRTAEYQCRFSAVELVWDSDGYERPQEPRDAPRYT